MPCLGIDLDRATIPTHNKLAAFARMGALRISLPLSLPLLPMAICYIFSALHSTRIFDNT